jgi:hypothetical protein
VAEHVPLPNAEGAAEGGYIVRVVLDPGGEGIGWRLREPTSTLIVEYDLAIDGEWGEGRPEERVIVNQAAIDEEERRAVRYWRGGPDGEVESTDRHGHAIEGGRAAKTAAEGDEVSA